MKKGIVEQLQEIAYKMCDRYCKYPDIYHSQYEDDDEGTEALYREQCKKCPLNKM